MEHILAESDTQTEVDILIFDYLLCIAIERALHAERRGAQGQADWNADWLSDTLKTLMSVLPPPETLSIDIQIKIRALETVEIFQLYDSNSTIQKTRGNEIPRENNAMLTGEPGQLSRGTKTFITLINLADGKISNIQWADIALQLCILAALEEYRAPKNEQEASFSERLARTTKYVDPGGSQDLAGHVDHVVPPPGPQFDAYINTCIKTMPPQQAKPKVFSIITDVMKVLEPPILIQLERGKINGLSRTDTQQLKDRVGLL